MSVDRVVLLVDAYWSGGVGEEDTQGPWGVAGLEPEGGKEGPRGPGWSWPRARRWVGRALEVLVAGLEPASSRQYT